MAKSWIDRLRGRRSRLDRRRRIGWLGRIDGVEKPALLVGLGMVLYRAWKAGDPAEGQRDGRWRGIFRRWRRRLEKSLRLGRRDGQGGASLPKQEVPDGAAGAAQRGEREHQSRLRHPPS